MKSGAVAEVEVAEKSQLTDEEVVEAISTEIKKRKDAAAQYEAAGRTELSAGETTEAAILMKYMPEQMSEDAVKALIAQAIAETGAAGLTGKAGAKDMGRVMGAVAPKTKGEIRRVAAQCACERSIGSITMIDLVFHNRTKSRVYGRDFFGARVSRNGTVHTPAQRAPGRGGHHAHRSDGNADAQPDAPES